MDTIHITSVNSEGVAGPTEIIESDTYTFEPETPDPLHPVPQELVIRIGDSEQRYPLMGHRINIFHAPKPLDA